MSRWRWVFGFLLWACAFGAALYCLTRIEDGQVVLFADQAGDLAATPLLAGFLGIFLHLWLGARALPPPERVRRRWLAVGVYTALLTAYLLASGYMRTVVAPPGWEHELLITMAWWVPMLAAVLLAPVGLPLWRGLRRVGTA